MHGTKYLKHKVISEQRKIKATVNSIGNKIKQVLRIGTKGWKLNMLNVSVNGII